MFRGDLLGPPRLPAEVINTIHQRYRSQDPKWDISDEETAAALRRFLAVPVMLLALAGLYEQAFYFALDHRLNTTYDAICVVLAQQLRVEMWTDDRALLRALGSSAAWRGGLVSPQQA